MDSGACPMKWRFFFDGACHLCSREVDHYLKIPGAEKIEFIDITGPTFSAQAYGLDPIAVNKAMHVISPDGAIFTGVDAFIEIWKVLPTYQTYARAANLPVVKPLLKMGYTIFARLRPYLPKRKDACEACAVRNELHK